MERIIYHVLETVTCNGQYRQVIA